MFFTVLDKGYIFPQDWECPICCYPHTDVPMVRTKCDHFFHGTCIIEWINKENKCPICEIILRPNVLNFSEKLVLEEDLRKIFRPDELPLRLTGVEQMKLLLRRRTDKGKWIWTLTNKVIKID